MEHSHKKVRIQERFFDTHHSPRLLFQENMPYARYMASMFMTYVIKHDSLLEVGAGKGRFTFALWQHFRSILATDLSGICVRELREYAASLGMDSIRSKQADITKLPVGVRSKTFDVIGGFHMLHHIPFTLIESAVKEMDLCMKKGSRMIFIEPNRFNPLHIPAIFLNSDESWETEKGRFRDFIGELIRGSKKRNMRVVARRVFGFLPPVLITRFPKIVFVDRWVERIPFLSIILCPFVIVVLEKT